MNLINLNPKKLKNLSPIILWDGLTLIRYRPTKGHDCLVIPDALISVQNVRRDFILQGWEPIVIFSCKRFMPSYEVCYPGDKWGGLFTQSIIKVWDENPKITIKDIITKTNIEMSISGLDQMCEVVCRQNLLELEYFTGIIPGKKIALFLYDMCRTAKDWGLKIANK
jgi:hypothetical protein